METRNTIQVLLLDDKAKNLRLGVESQGRTVLVPQLHAYDADVDVPDVTECFELRWLANPAEAREFRDLSLAVALTSPALLLSDGWLPELLLVDYALTGDEKAVETRGLPQPLVEELSPLPDLRACVASRGIEKPTLRDRPKTDAPHDADDMGCFAGGLILSSFSDHPSATVVTTRKDKDRVRPDAAFFEWLIENESGGSFVAKGDPGSTWHELLARGVVALRKRLIQLAKADVVALSMKDLLALSEDGNHVVLTFSSRYGRRKWPVRGLFIDCDAASRPAKAMKWARDVLRQHILSRLHRSVEMTEEEFLTTKSEITQGERLADALWEAYDDDTWFDARARLSELLLLRDRLRSTGSDLGLAEAAELDTLMGPSWFEVSPKQGSSMECGYHVEWRMGRFSDGARRWAALLMIVRMLQLRMEAAERWDDERIKRRTNPKYDGIARRYDHRIDLPLDARDVYLAIFPLPRKPVILPFHKGDPAASWDHALDHDQGETALSIADVLSGLSWSQEPSDQPKLWRHGLLPGERFILRLYAEAYGMDMRAAAGDAQARLVLWGATPAEDPS